MLWRRRDMEIPLIMSNKLKNHLYLWCHVFCATLAQVMVCYLPKASHYLNQHWLHNNKVMWHSPENFTWSDQATLLYNVVEFFLQLLTHLPTTIDCRYNVVRYNMVLLISLQEVAQNINQSLNPQKPPPSNSSPFREYFGENWPHYNGTAL